MALVFSLGGEKANATAKICDACQPVNRSGQFSAFFALI
jgi:hypothetical protein